MILHDAAIRAQIQAGRIGIEPFDASRLQPASYDLTLGSGFIAYRKVEEALDPLQMITNASVDHFFERSSYPLPSRLFLLGHTVETVTLGPDVGAMCLGVSSLARLGLQVEAAGWVDPGFSGQLTLEIVNHNHRAILLRPGMVIAQLVLFGLQSDCERVYGAEGLGSRYQHQNGATGPRVKKA